MPKAYKANDKWKMENDIWKIALSSYLLIHEGVATECHSYKYHEPEFFCCMPSGGVKVTPKAPPVPV